MAELEYKKEGRIAYFTINRPDAMNALNINVNRLLEEAMLEFQNDNEVWVGIITGAGDKAFCAGADIKETLPYLRDNSEKMWNFPRSHTRRLDVWKPLIAAIKGFCLGGGLEVALGCDIRIAGENAKIGLPEVTLGLIPGDGGTQRLPRVIPAAKAAEMLFTGKIIGAAEALQWGLVNTVVPVEEVMNEALKMAQQINKSAPLAVRSAKQAMLRGQEMSLDDGLRLEYMLNAFCTHTEDFDEGTSAFIGKRKAEFKGL